MTTKHRFEDREHVLAYKKYRNELPIQIVKRILLLLEESFEVNECTAVDVGCGPGQSARPIAPFLKKVIGIDISEEQIRAANEDKPPNAEFIVGSCYSVPIPDQSVELVLAVSAFHWFDTDLFYREVDRVLKPNGVLAIVRNSQLTVSSGIVGYEKEWQLLREEWRELMEQYWDPVTLTIDNEYKTTKLPYEMNITDESVVIVNEVNISHIVNRTATMSGVAKFLQEEPVKAKKWLNDFEKKLMKMIGSSTKPEETMVKFARPYTLLMSRKP